VELRVISLQGVQSQKKERKFFGRRIESGRSVDEMSETELREWVKEQIEGFEKGKE